MNTVYTKKLLSIILFSSSVASLAAMERAQPPAQLQIPLHVVKFKAFKELWQNTYLNLVPAELQEELRKLLNEHSIAVRWWMQADATYHGENYYIHYFNDTDNWGNWLLAKFDPTGKRIIASSSRSHIVVFDASDKNAEKKVVSQWHVPGVQDFAVDPCGDLPSRISTLNKRNFFSLLI